MEIWCDSASERAIPLLNQGWIKGVTTNPKVLSQRPQKADQQLDMLLKAQTGFVAVQVTAQSAQGMLAQAKKLHHFSDRIMLKIPFTPDGIAILPELKILNIPTLATAVFKAEQFLLAASIGVDYVAPYLSHMTQVGLDALGEVSAMQAMIKHYGFTTKVMAASVQHNYMISQLASLGVASITLSLDNLLSCCKNEYTIKSTERLNESWKDFADYQGHLFETPELV